MTGRKWKGISRENMRYDNKVTDNFIKCVRR